VHLTARYAERMTVGQFVGAGGEEEMQVNLRRAARPGVRAGYLMRAETWQALNLEEGFSICSVQIVFSKRHKSRYF